MSGSVSTTVPVTFSVCCAPSEPELQSVCLPLLAGCRVWVISLSTAMSASSIAHSVRQGLSCACIHAAGCIGVVFSCSIDGTSPVLEADAVLATATAAFHAFIADVDHVGIALSSERLSLRPSTPTVSPPLLLATVAVDSSTRHGAAALVDALWASLSDERVGSGVFDVPLPWTTLRNRVRTWQRRAVTATPAVCREDEGRAPELLNTVADVVPACMSWSEFEAAASGCGVDGADGLRRAAAFLDALGVIVYKGRTTAGSTSAGHLTASQPVDDVVVVTPQLVATAMVAAVAAAPGTLARNIDVG